MKRRADDAVRLTAAQLVDAVERAGLCEPVRDDSAWEAERLRRLRSLLDDLGYNPLLWVRARLAVTSPDTVARGFVWDDPISTPSRLEAS